MVAKRHCRRDILVKYINEAQNKVKKYSQSSARSPLQDATLSSAREPFVLASEPKSLTN